MPFKKSHLLTIRSYRRIAKEINTDPPNSSSGITTQFVYSGDNVLLEFVDEVFHQRYLHGPAVDQMLAQENADGEIIWNLTDHLGTGRDLIDNNGNLVNHLTYDSFGNVVAQTDDTVKSRYLFTGREFDSETGLYYYRARYYDGQIGRFISEDAIGFAGGDPNLYRYVNNQPVLSRDPSGLIDEELYQELIARLAWCQQQFGTGPDAFKPDPMPERPPCRTEGGTGGYTDPYHSASLKREPLLWLHNFDRRVDLFNQYADDEIGHRNQLKQRCKEIQRAL